MNRWTKLSFAALALLSAQPASADTITPATYTTNIPVGGTATVRKTVTVTRQLTVPLDVFFLTDTTGSMGAAIAGIRTGFSSIVTSVAGVASNAAFGAGEYKDHTDSFAYRENQDITTNVSAVQTAISAWSAAGGGDAPEANLFALEQVANGAAWRPGSQRIVVWVGDAPGHDPSRGVTEASATAALKAAGVTVLAASTTGGVGGLNVACGGAGCAAGQATRITAATGGQYLGIFNSSTITTAITNALTGSLSNYSRVELVAVGAPAGVRVTVPPATVGTFDRTTDRNFDFEVTFTGVAPGTYNFTIEARVDGRVVATENDTIVVGDTVVTPTVNPAQLTFTSVNGSLPAAQTLTLSAPASAVAEVQTPTGGNWLVIAFVPNGTNIGTRLNVSINPASLPALTPGSYTGRIRIVSPTTGTTFATVPVTLLVTVQDSLPTFPPVRIPSAAAVCPSVSLTVGEPYRGTLSATGGGAFIDWNVRGNFPPGLMLVGNTVTGAPNTAGTYTYEVEATSGPYSATMTCSVTVQPGPLRITTGCPTTSAPQGSYYAFPVIPSGGMGGSSYQYSATGLPAGLTIANGRITGNPTADPGSYSFQIQVSSGGQTATLQCSITVAEPLPSDDRPRDPLRLTGVCPAAFQVGGTVSVSATASGGEGGYRFTMTGGPSWLTLASTATTATLSGVAPAAGNFPVEITVTDGKGATQRFSCTVAVNAPPLTMNAPACPEPVTLGGTVTLPLSASGGRGTLTWRVDGPSWLTLSATTGTSVTLSGTPADVGNIPFTVTVTDEDNVSRQFSSCTLRVVAAPIQITGTCPSTVERPAGLSLNLSATGGVAPLQWRIEGPSFLTLSPATGASVRVTGVPAAQGSYSFTVTAADERGTTPATLTCSFTVPALVPPTVQITGLTASVGQTQTGNLELRLSAPAPANLRAIVDVRLEPTVDIPNFTFGNPWVQFGPLTPSGSTGPTVVQRYTIETTIPAGATAVPLGAGVNLSDVAGTVRVQLRELRDGNQNLLGSGTPPSATFAIPRQAPVIRQESVQFTRSQIVFAGSTSTLDIQSVTLTFNPRQGAEIEGSRTISLSTELQSRVQQRFRERFAAAAGGNLSDPMMGAMFEITIPLTIQGDADAIESVSIAIVNSAGTTQSGPHPLR
jgi:hypothetical protein